MPDLARLLWTELGKLWQRAFAPKRGFESRAAEGPSLGEAVKGLLWVRTGPAFLALFFMYFGLGQAYGRFARMEGPAFDYLWAHLPDSVNPADVREAFHALPASPSLAHGVPWIVVLAPLWVLSLWLHDACWDHLSLWMLRGLRQPRSFRLTLVAEAEALKVGAIGATFDLLGSLPGVGCFLQVLLLPVGIYFWILRGFALSAWHGAPVWKGVLATLAHALLMALFTAVVLGCFLILVLQAVRA